MSRSTEVLTLPGETIRRRQFDNSKAVALHQQALMGRILAARGVCDSSELDLRLDTLLRPNEFAGYQQAVEHLCNAIQQERRILIVGDYDADGATSTALAWHVLKSIGSAVDYLVPNRFEFGYGLSPEIVDVALRRSPDLILTVDNGIVSHSGVERAREAGVTVVVTDHHLPSETLPAAEAIVNPNRSDCQFASKHLCGVGVVFYVMVGVCRQLQNCGLITRENSPRMADYLDLVALGTVADVVSLDRNNRVLVEQGLKRIRTGATRPGILALFDVAARDHQQATTSDIGFAIGPRLNAAGRLDDMSIGIECLLAEDMEHALPLARRLDEFNRKRRKIQSGMGEAAQDQLSNLPAQENIESSYAVTVYDPQWHEGVVGILAGRLKEQCYRPVFAFARSENGVIKGSGRSIEGVHIRDILVEMAARNPQLLSKFGGHAMAAGATMPEANIDVFKEAFNEQVKRQLNGQYPQREWLTDGALSDSEITLANAQVIKYLQPWGQAFPAPLFDDIFEIKDVRPVGTGHSRLRLCQPGGRRELQAMAFNREVTSEPGQHWHIVYRLEVNSYKGRESLQLLVEYLMPVD